MLLPAGEAGKDPDLVERLRSVFSSIVSVPVDLEDPESATAAASGAHPETRFTVVSLGTDSVAVVRRMLEETPKYPGYIFILDAAADEELGRLGAVFCPREKLIDSIKKLKRDEAEVVKRQVIEAFTAAEYPGDENLRGSDEGEEPYLLEDEFEGKTDWRALDAEFIDKAPDGYGSALSFFSRDAFRFYLPAYLTADLDDALDRQNPVFHLTHGLTDRGKTERVNPRRYGDKTWFESSSHRLSTFNRQEAKAIVAYLRFKSKESYLRRVDIEQALRNFWNKLAGDPPGG